MLQRGILDPGGIHRPRRTRYTLNHVPPKHVLTPGGYRHQSRVHKIQRGQHAMRSVGSKDATKETVTPIGSGWNAYCGWVNNTGAPVSFFQTRWIVPPPPTTGSEQTIFLFNAMEDAEYNDIVQPVLQWGVSAAGDIKKTWAASSWYINPQGHAFYTNLVPVEPGTELLGWMTLLSQNGAAFDYRCEFAGLPETQLETHATEQLTWCTETLETYKVKQCSDYPNVTATRMDAIDLRTTLGYAPIIWNPVVKASGCGQGIAIRDNSPVFGAVDLYYRNFPRGM